MTAAQTHTIRPRRRGRIWLWVIPGALLLLALVGSRFVGFQLFRMPSGSMQPTLHVGDYIAASKWAYGFSRYSVAPFEGLAPHGRVLTRLPVRGDIVVFRPSPEPDRDFVKRIVGLPGDHVRMMSGALYINGEPVRRQSMGEVAFQNEYGGVDNVQEFRETLSNGVSYDTFDRGETELDNTREFVVPTDSYFVLGDDRDNSADSRVASVVGFVPLENLVGRVDHIFPRRP